MFFKSKKLFGNDILPSCEYCLNAKPNENDVYICCIDNCSIVDDMCKHFIYDPLKRVPITRTIRMPKYSPEDFIL